MTCELRERLPLTQLASRIKLSELKKKKKRLIARQFNFVNEPGQKKLATQLC